MELRAIVLYFCIFWYFIFLEFNYSYSLKASSSSEQSSEASNPQEDESDSYVELGDRFPTLGSFFSWLQNLSSLQNQCVHDYSTFSGVITTSDNQPIQATGLKVLSSIISCLRLVKKAIHSYNSNLGIEENGISLSGTVLSCFRLLKKDSITAFTDLASSHGNTLNFPLLLNVFYLVIKCYILSHHFEQALHGYLQLLENIKVRAETQIKVLEGESNCEKKELLNGLLGIHQNVVKLVEYIFSVLNGSYMFSNQVSDLEKLILTDTKNLKSKLDGLNGDQEPFSVCPKSNVLDDINRYIQGLTVGGVIYCKKKDVTLMERCVEMLKSMNSQ